MADLILHKRSSTASAVPSAGSIALGELAINTADGRLFLKKGDGTVVDVTSIGGIQGLTDALAGKEPAIASGTVAQYVAGDKSLRGFGDNVRAQLLTGLPTPTNVAILNTDHILAAMAKLQGQVTARMTNPMTTAGDMIRGGTSGAPERVAAGTNGYVWTMVAGVPGWAAPAGGSDAWASRAIGEPFPIWDHIAGVPVPPTDNAGYRYIKLTASDAYNSGVLTSEAVSGSAPLVQATAVISDSASPINGQTVRLINTERRFIRAGSSGTVEQDAMQGHHHASATGIGGWSDTTVSTDGPANLANVIKYTAGTYQWVRGPISDGTNGTPRTASETRPKNIGATYYMRIR